MKRRTGRFETTTVADEKVRAFVPVPLPPVAPPLNVDAALGESIRSAEQALARLDLAGEMVPSVDWFIYAFVRKEAVLSSQIEGTQATLIDLLSYEARTDHRRPDEDVEEVCNYLDALTFAREQMGRSFRASAVHAAAQRCSSTTSPRSPGREEDARADSSQPELVGGSRPGNAVHVPPPPHTLPQLLSELERYIHVDDELPAIVRAGLLHVQFETIHPYLDGNGRIGRLLIVLLLQHWQLLSRPLLYLSLFFKRHRSEYYRRLSAVRSDGDWEGWLDFFLHGISTVANEAVETARDLFSLVATDRERVIRQRKTSLAAVRLFESLPKRPLITAAWVVDALQTTKPTAGRAIEALEAAGVLVEITGKKRDRVFSYQAYLERLRSGTDL